MTNFEAIRSDLLTYTANRTKIEKELILAGLTADGEFESSNQPVIAAIVIKILRGFRHLTGESEGGLSNSYDPDKLNAYLLEYAADNGLSNLVSDITAGDSIRNRSDIW